MLEYLKNEANMTATENGAVTHISTRSDCVDLFATIGALRNADENESISRFSRAYAEDPDIAMKILFFARDVRGGLGERRVFRTILTWLCNHHKDSVIKNVEYIAEFGRFDDLLTLFDTSCEGMAIEVIKKQMERDICSLKSGIPVSLLAKWMPSVNASNCETVRIAKKLARKLGLTEREYRKQLVALRKAIKIIENNLRKKDYTFDYSKQPSGAMLKYRAAFFRNDGERYGLFLDNVKKGEATINMSNVEPYRIIHEFFKYSRLEKEYDLRDVESFDVMWKNIKDHTNDSNAIVVVDGSGSMYRYGSNIAPIDVALSLGIYFAERNTGAFRNHFITFSHNPRLVEIKGQNIFEKAEYCSDFCEVANTDLQKVFELVLKAAVQNNVPQSELPETIYIVSDMEFDSCIYGADITNFEYAKKLFEEKGYKLPNIVFWNVDSRNCQQPVTKNEQGVTLVSGFTPRLFDMVVGKDISPYKFMIETVCSERYSCIAA